MRLVFVFVLLVCFAASSPAKTVRLPIGTSGPRLDAVPGPQIDTANLPALAIWPTLRHERPLHLLAILGKNESAAAYQRIARRLRATLDLRYLGGGDDRYHVNDKWIEPKDNPTLEELVAASKKIVLNTISAAADRPQDQVIFCHAGLDDSAIQQALVRFIDAGGLAVVCGNFYPQGDAPLAKCWPAKPKNHSWMSGGAKRSGRPELAGVPMEFLAGHAWIPIAEATPESVALAVGEAGSMFYRKVGHGGLLFVPTGPISRKHDAVAALGRKYDHDEIWLRAWDQSLYTLVRGDGAIPAYADIEPASGTVPPDSDFLLRAKVVNRAHRGPLAVAMHVTDPRGRVVFVHQQSMEIASGKEACLETRIPVPRHWAAGLYPLYLTVADPATKRQFHQAMDFVPVAGVVELSLASEKKGYATGEEARLLLTASSKSPWTGSLRFGVYDFRGRLLAAEEKPASLTGDKQEFRFSYRVADHGVRVDTYWAELAAVAEGKEFGRAEAKFARYDRWSTRNEYQWSTWSGIACAQPSVVPAGMRLMAHAGMNALGYPGRSELYYPAERWGWRYYNENIGTNTFAPVIEYENDGEIEAALLKESERTASNPDLTSAAFVLGSVGEEAGFKHGWGTRYYWDTPVAPEKACKAFHWFLKQKYPDLASLNEAWKTKYRSWEEIKLTKEFSARGGVKLDADGWAHPQESPLGSGVAAVSLAPYLDTADFYDWYYDRIIAVARRILKERINPVTQTMSSAPTIGSAKYDVRVSGPGCWNESQSFSVMDGPEPGFGLIWGHFDWSVMTDNMFWGFLLTRSGHNNYWVDIPLMFNNDMTHTRASFAMRCWTHRLADHERVILDSRPMASEVAVLGPNGFRTSLMPANMLTSLQVALSQGGFGLAASDPAKLDGVKILFAIGRQAMTQHEADGLDAYVQGGGTLVFTPRFASQTGLGVAQPVSPGCGLAQKWRFQVTEKAATIPQHHPHETVSANLDTIGESFKGQGLQLATEKIFRERVRQDGWSAIAAYSDGVPAILTRQHGKGRLVYVNAVYQSHWYIQWITPTGSDRQGFYRLIEWLCTQAGARRTLRLDGNLAETLHMAVKQFTDPTGAIGYVLVRTNGEVPWTAGVLNWLGPQSACYDVLGGTVGQPAPLLGKQVPIQLPPGEGRLLAFVQSPVRALRVTAQPGVVVAGQSLRLSVAVLDNLDRPVTGSFPLELRAASADGEIAGIRRSFSAESGGEVTLNTAINDPAGEWTIHVTDGVSRVFGNTRVRVTAADRASRAPGFIPWGQLSEVPEPAKLSEAEFGDCLCKLAALYQRDLSNEGWMTKQYLGYHYDFFPGTRHDLLRPLDDVDWRVFAPAIRKAIADGETLIVTGEDVGLHPGSGLATYPHNDGRQLDALALALDGASWSIITPDGDTASAVLGKGRLILCRESIDAAGHTNPDAASWQARWRNQREAKYVRPIAPPDASKLQAWWTGMDRLATGLRTVSWFADNRREVKLSLDPNKPLGETLALVIPPTGAVTGIRLRIATNGDGKLRFDLACDGTVDLETAAGKQEYEMFGPLSKAWTDAANRYLQWAAANHTGPHRDGSGWRTIPIRVHADMKKEVTLSGLEVVVE